MTCTIEHRTGWLVCRHLTEIPVPDFEVLSRWAERGRIRLDDYLVNPALETCFQVKDVPELKRILRKPRLPHLDIVRRTLAAWVVAAQ